MEQQIEFPAAHHTTQQRSVKFIWVPNIGFCAGFWALVSYLIWAILR